MTYQYDAIDKLKAAQDQCRCHSCIKEFDLRGVDGLLPLSATQMITCPQCGNKRCPHAADHRNQCTNPAETSTQTSDVSNTETEQSKCIGVVKRGDALDFCRHKYHAPECPQYISHDEYIAELEARNAKLVTALRPFAALLQPHNDNGPDTTPVFAVNEAVITLGDLRKAQQEQRS